MTALEEARAILKGETVLLATREHLLAIEEHYQSEILRIVHEYDSLNHRILKRN